MFFEPYLNPAAGVVCRDGGLKQNNPIEKALNEIKTIWGKGAILDVLLSVGSGRSKLPPNKPVSRFVVKGWLATLFDTFMTTFNGEDQWDSFSRVVEDSVKERTKRLNIRFDTDREPALDDTSSIPSMKRTAQDYSFYMDESHSLVRPGTESMLEEVGLLLRAGLFFFHPTSVKLNQDQSVSVIKGVICCRLSPGDVPCRELVSLSEGFEVPGLFVPMPSYEQCRSKLMIEVDFQHDMHATEKQIDISVKFNGGHTVPISGSPFEFQVGYPNPPCKVVHQLIAGTAN